MICLAYSAQSHYVEKYFYKIYGVRRIPGIDICQNKIKDSGISKGKIKKELYHSQFPRYIGLDQKEMVEYKILVFCDASKYTFGAIVYLRQENEVSCRIDLIFSKARLVPNKKISIPRLELLAAFIGKRYLKCVEEEL